MGFCTDVLYPYHSRVNPQNVRRKLKRIYKSQKLNRENSSFKWKNIISPTKYLLNQSVLPSSSSVEGLLTVGYKFFQVHGAYSNCLYPKHD